MRIFHIASRADWRRARRTGAYTTSTRGRTLAEEGFLHASRLEQVAGVFERYYRGAQEPLLLLTIATERLDVPWREEPVGEDTYPHIYGPLSPRAVISTVPLNREGRTPPFTVLFVTEIAARAWCAVLSMVLAAAGSECGRLLLGPGGRLPGALAGLLLGLAVSALLLRRRA